jgi:hypothetical protein
LTRFNAGRILPKKAANMGGLGKTSGGHHESASVFTPEEEIGRRFQQKADLVELAPKRKRLGSTESQNQPTDDSGH